MGNLKIVSLNYNRKESNKSSRLHWSAALLAMFGPTLKVFYANTDAVCTWASAIR